MSAVPDGNAVLGGDLSSGETLAWSILDGLPGAAVIVFDHDLRVLTCAGAALASRGFDRAAMVGQRLGDVLPAATFAQYEQHYRRAAAGETSYLETETVDRERVFATEFSPLRHPDGSVAGGIAVSRDVTDARRSQEALAVSERQFRDLAEQSGDLQARLTPDGTLLFVSAAAQSVLGYAPEELVGTNVHALMHEDDLAELPERWTVLRLEEGVVRQEVRFRHRDGSWRWCESAVRLVRDPSTGTASESHCSIRDITERRESDERRWQWEQTFTGTSRGICVTDLDSGLIDSVNPAYARMHGGTIEDFVGQPGTMSLSPERGAQLPERGAQLPEPLGGPDGGALVRADSEHRRLDGTAFPVRAEVLAVRDPRGRLRHRIAWFDDLTEQHAVEAARRDATEMFEIAFSRAPMGVALIGFDGRFLRVNAALCEMLGRTEDEVIGSTSRAFTHPDDLPATAAAFAHLSTEAAPLSVQKRYLRPNGEVVWAATRGTAVSGSDGRPSHIVSHFHDITAIKVADERRAEATARFEAAFADAPIGMAIVGLDGRWLRVNRVLCELSGYTEETLLGLTFQDLTHVDDLDADLEQIAQLLAGEIDRYTMRKRYHTARGDLIWTTLAVSLVRDGNGRPLYFISQIEDISEQKRLEAELRHLADHDPLTELWNRRRFQEELDRQIARGHRYGESAAVLMIDLDGFKQINDTHGHTAGDELLRRIAQALRERLRSTDSLARLGGDEFAVLLSNVTAEQAERLAVTFAETIGAARIAVQGLPVGVTASVGVANLDARDDSDHERVLTRADRSMYKAKASARSPVAGAAVLPTTGSDHRPIGFRDGPRHARLPGRPT